MTSAFSGSTAARHRQLFESVFQQATDAMLILDSTDRVLRVNARAERLFGLDERDMRGTLVGTLLHPSSDRVSPEPVVERTPSSSESKPGSWVSSINGGEGRRTPVVVTISAIADADQSLWMAVVRELLPSRTLPQWTVQQVLHDPLTGLPNRDLFQDRLGRAVDRSRRRPDYGCAVLMLDVDRFQTINGSLGHALGDELLRSIAERLKAYVETGDTIARIGGDEFAILMDDVREPNDVIRVADRLVHELSAPFSLRGHQVYSSVSVGIALGATAYRHASELLRDADTAMYHAKELGRGRHAMFDSTMRARARRLHHLESGLRRALEQKQLRVYYQPIVSHADDRFVGFEALVRWEHPKWGSVSPAEFIPVAEDTGLIVPIGTWVLREACSQLKDWQDSGFNSLRVAVNCSARQLEQPSFVDEINEAIGASGVPAGAVELEITEGEIMRQLEVSLATLNALHTRGLRISVDDFGIGYSALGYLQKLPLKSLKIDRTFIHDLSRDKRTAAIVNAIVVLAHSLQLNAVAEGVETSEQLNFLRSIRCDEYQGFLVNGPVPADQAWELLAAGQAQRALVRT